MGIATEAARQANRATKTYAHEMGRIAGTAAKAEAAVVKKAAADVAFAAKEIGQDALILGTWAARETKATVKGAAANGIDHLSRGLTRADQFATGAAIAGKMQVKAIGQDVAAAGREAKAFALADLHQTAADIRWAARETKATVKGAALTGIDLADRGLTRADQFVTGAALATKMEAKAIGQDVALAAGEAKDFTVRHLRSGYSTAKGAVNAGIDQIDRGLTRAGRFATDVAIAGKTAVDQGVQHVEMQAAIVTHNVKNAGRAVEAGFEAVELRVRGEVAQGRTALGESLIRAGQRIAQ